MVTTPKIASTSGVYETLSSGDFSRVSSGVLFQPPRTTQRLLVLGDLLVIWAASALTLVLRFSPMIPVWSGRRSDQIFHVGVHAGLLLLYSGLVVLSCHAHNLYRGLRAGSAWHEAWQTIKAVATATIMLSTLIFVLHAHMVSRLVVGITAVLTAAALVARRHVRRSTTANRVTAGYGCRNVLIVGSGAIGRALEKHLNENKQFGYLVKGFLDCRRVDSAQHGIQRRQVEDDRILGSVEELPTIARALFIDEVLITVPSDRELVKRVAAQARACGLAVRVMLELYDGLAWHAPIEYLGLFPIMSLHQKPIREVEFLVKRGLDIVISAAALVIASPLLIATACAIYLDDRGPIFYRSLRVGKKGKTFQCLKFRTMVVNAEQMLESLQHLNEREGLLFKISNDPRVTKVGRWLRKYSIDEIPQFWNVLKGEMSLVGPRPPLATEFEKYNLEYFRRLDAVPGITGIWQVEARQDPSFSTYINLDLHYVEHWSLLLDLKLLFKTVAVVLAGTGR
jgi:exopolysaccharide biosynthesis polyprenyl glycosylphosphotransferase